MKTNGFLKKRNKRGSTLIVVLGLSTLILVGGAALSKMSMNAMHVSRIVGYEAKAIYIAEAGVADMMELLDTDFDTWKNATLTNSFGGGDYVVATTQGTGLSSGRENAVIRSTGTYRDFSRNTALEIAGPPSSVWDGFISGYGAIIAGGDVTFHSGAGVINGWVHSNKSIIGLTGGSSPDFNGAISASGSISAHFVPSGSYPKMENAPNLLVPTYLPLNSWQTLAQNGQGTYYNSSVAFASKLPKEAVAGTVLVKNDTISPVNGLLFVNGNVYLENKNILNGTIVATGSIVIGNQFRQHNPVHQDWPALIAETDITVRNNTTFNGILFAGRDISVENRTPIIGSLIALNSVHIGQRAVVTPQTDPPDWDPGDSGSAKKVSMVGWLK